MRLTILMHVGLWVPIAAVAASGAAAQFTPGLPDQPQTPGSVRAIGDADSDGLPDHVDPVPRVTYEPGFDWETCAPMDLNPDNDSEPACKARERIARFMLTEGAFMTQIAFAVVVEGEVYFADAFTYIGGGRFERNPEGVNLLYRVGSTSKSIVASAAKSLEESGVLSLDDFVDDDDGTRETQDSQRTLRDLLTHQGAFSTDYGAIHLFCYPGDLAAFWANDNDLISPHYDSGPYGNLGGGYSYSAFNYSLAGAYLAWAAGDTFERVIQTQVFNRANMATATLSGPRAASAPIGGTVGISQGGAMHVGPYINLVSPTDEYCEDNFYSTDDIYGETQYSWQPYRLDEAAAEARDPAGGVIASVIDMAHFAVALLDSYHERGGIMSRDGVIELWSATHDLGCGGNCPYERYYGVGFFTNSLSGHPIDQVGHGGSRPGFTSAFVLRPEADLAVCILTNADASTVTISDLAKMILDDFEE